MSHRGVGHWQILQLEVETSDEWMMKMIVFVHFLAWENSPTIEQQCFFAGWP